MPRHQEEMLLRSKHLSYFQQHGEIYAYHDLFGYIIGMSRDLVDLLEFHSQLRTREEVDTVFGEHFEKEQLDEYLMVLKLFSCLIDSELGEWRSLWEMVPVRTRWTVWHQPAPAELTLWRTDRAGVTSSEDAPSWAARLWASIDGKQKLDDLFAEIADDPALQGEDKPRDVALELLTRWVHHERQYLKFSKAPLWKFGPEHQWPSYLRSTMPFGRWVPGKDPEPKSPLEEIAVPINPPHGYYEDEVTDAEKQFTEVETTLSHLFRNPHPTLAGGTYGQRVTQYLVRSGRLGPATRTIVEVGAGMGHLCAGVLSTLRDEHPELYEAVSYTIVDLAPALREQQQKRVVETGHEGKVTWLAQNAEELQLEPGSVDLLLCNEVVGDFTTVKLNREVLGLTEELEPQAAFQLWTAARDKRLGEAGRLIRDYTMPLRDAPDEFYFNVGAIRFVEKVCEALSPTGHAFITEYGDQTQYPVASTQLDHIEFSIQFGHLIHIARYLGAEAKLRYVQDILDVDRDAQMLETTRTYFVSLRAMLASFGVELDKIAYTDQMFEELLGDKVPLEHIGDIRFRIFDERCMGVAPHEFKALLIAKQAPNALEL